MPHKFTGKQKVTFSIAILILLVTIGLAITTKKGILKAGADENPQTDIIIADIADAVDPGGDKEFHKDKVYNVRRESALFKATYYKCPKNFKSLAQMPIKLDFLRAGLEDKIKATVKVDPEGTKKLKENIRFGEEYSLTTVEKTHTDGSQVIVVPANKYPMTQITLGNPPKMIKVAEVVTGDPDSYEHKDGGNYLLDARYLTIVKLTGAKWDIKDDIILCVGPKKGKKNSSSQNGNGSFDDVPEAFREIYPGVGVGELPALLDE